MNANEVRRLRSGDRVRWNDPDNGICSRTIIIGTIEVSDDRDEDDPTIIVDPDPTVLIIDKDGLELECYASELE